MAKSLEKLGRRNVPPNVCKFWTRGQNCRNGNECKYFHACGLCWRAGASALDCCNRYQEEHGSGHGQEIEAEKKSTSVL